MVTEPPALQRLPRDRARLRTSHRDPFDEPVALARHLAVGVRGRREHVAEHPEQVRQAVGEAGAADLQTFRVDAHAEVAADGRELVVDPDAVAGGRAGEQGGRQQLRHGRVLGRGGAVRRGERDAQAQLHHRHPGPVGGKDAQPVGQRLLDHVRKGDRAGGA
jgi:hypothetical protein